jgi:guanine deaminase
MVSAEPEFLIFRGALVQAASDTRADYTPDGLVLVDPGRDRGGRILAIGPVETVAATYGLDPRALPTGERSNGGKDLWLPAFFDTHFHWVQDAVREMPKYSLIEWLNTITFPEEAKFADAAYAEERAASFWKQILSLGTVGGLCYSSPHEVALEAAFRHAPRDFYIGNVLMTMECPGYLQQNEADSIARVQRCAGRFGPRYVASPRFAPTTAPAVMRAAAEAAQAVNSFQQTHLGETLAEIDWVLGIYQTLPGFEDVSSYAEIYNRVGMLGEKTVLGHCLHLKPEEWELLADSGSRIASCPTSNAPVEQMGLGSGLFDYPTAEAYGIPWALASDIGGGPYLSMFDVMHSFVEQNRELSRQGATYTKALRRSTAMGAALMDLPNRGMLDRGASFDAIRVGMPEGTFQAGPAEPVLAALCQQVSDRKDYEELVLETFIRGESRFKREVKPCV